MADYKVVPVDLTNGLDKSELVQKNLQVYSVTVLELPGGANLLLHFGERGAIPVQQGDSFRDPRACPIENDGLYGTATVQPGVSARLYVGFSGAEATK